MIRCLLSRDGVNPMTDWTRLEQLRDEWRREADGQRLLYEDRDAGRANVFDKCAEQLDALLAELKDPLHPWRSPWIYVAIITGTASHYAPFPEPACLLMAVSVALGYIGGIRAVRRFPNESSR